MTKVFNTISPTAFRTLKQVKNTGRVVPIDATWYLGNKTQAYDEFKNNRLEGAVFFDLDKVATPLKYPHMLPLYSEFNKQMSQLGVKKDDNVVVYDRQGQFLGPRAAWTLALFGHPKVYVLDNFPIYENHGYPVDHSELTLASGLPPSTYEAISNSEFEQNYKDQVVEYDEVLQLAEDGKIGKDVIFLDVRPAARFTAETPEPRAGVKLGHIPGSVNFPFANVRNGDLTFKSKEHLVKALADHGIDATLPEAFLDGKKEVIVLCGSGTTAVLVKFALENVLGLKVPLRVYDGLWSEWGDRAPEHLVVQGKE